MASLPAATRRLLGVEHDLESLRQDRRPVDLPTIDPQAEAAVVFTSGATGPSKGVRYGAAQIDAQIRLLIERYEIGPDDSLVAAFAPFALYGPAMGITSTVPDIDVSRPGSLTANLLRIRADEALRAGLSAANVERARLYSPSEMTRQYVDVYNRLVKGSNVETAVT